MESRHALALLLLQVVMQGPIPQPPLAALLKPRADVAADKRAVDAAEKERLDQAAAATEHAGAAAGGSNNNTTAAASEAATN